jgi:hypothetical protein
LWVSKTPADHRHLVIVLSLGASMTENCWWAVVTVKVRVSPSSVCRYWHMLAVRVSNDPRLRALGYSNQDPLIPALTVPEVSWESLPWTVGSCGSSADSSNESPSTPALPYSSSSTELPSGDQTIQMSSFIDIAPSPG